MHSHAPARRRSRIYAWTVTRSFNNEPDARRYTLRDGDELLATLDYSSNGHAVSLTRAFTAPQHRGKGLAAEIVEFAVDDLETSSDLRIVPMCWYVGEWFDKHPERSGLLTR
ncbi:MAG: N-acetyltransferase [Microbacteriaceae bacterium]|nr:N-acetyltransferase [Microbacteriaceae bacterium]